MSDGESVLESLYARLTEVIESYYDGLLPTVAIVGVLELIKQDMIGELLSGDYEEDEGYEEDEDGN